jgi:L-lactate dehydrogenase complex protein LldG
LTRVRSALEEASRPPAERLPSTIFVPPRVPADLDAEIELLFAEIRQLAGQARRIRSRGELAQALAGLVEVELIRRATIWDTPDLRALDVAETLDVLRVQLVPPDADTGELATCDLGVTGADLVLPETGTLVLRTSAVQPQAVSLLPRIHLAIFRPLALRADLHPAFDLIKHDRHALLITGPSRTADIEKTLVIGMHGPKALHVWCYEGE